MNRTNSLPHVLTLDEAAGYLRISKKVVRDLATRGSLPARQIDRDWRFLKSALDDWLRGRDGRSRLLKQAGALAHDDTMPELMEAIYAARGRPETDDGNS